MELLSPAGDIEKLSYAYAYGSDAAYIGLQEFSLRTRAGSITSSDIDRLYEIKGNKKLYAALNSYFNEDDLKRLLQRLPSIEEMPFDAFIVSDLGAAATLQDHFGDDVTFHLSTQANALNSKAVGMYQKLGFSRIILGRETPLSDIAEIKIAHPEMEIEVFVHGAMCMAYSGRCFLSAFMANRSANKGDCAHACRWNYRLMEAPSENLVLEEESRPGEYYPVYEGDGYTTILSSKDLCMIDHLDKLYHAGVDSLKIEGRMKSLYYVATVTRAYRKAIDALMNNEDPSTFKAYRDELFEVSHREYSTGFFFDKEEISIPTDISYMRNYLFIGTVDEQLSSHQYRLTLKNKIHKGMKVEYIGPDTLALEDTEFSLYDLEGNELEVANHHQQVILQTKQPISSKFILRSPINR